MQNIVIDPEFKSLIPPLTDDERNGLEESILADGCRDALILWGNILVDGHNRYEICKKHGIEYRTVQKEFKDRNEAKLWMISNQLARRNLTEQQYTYFVGKKYESEKHTNGGNRGNQYTKVAEVQNDPLPTAEKVAKELGISSGTVKRAAQYAHGIDTIRSVHPELADSILSAETKVPKKDVAAISTPEDVEFLAQTVDNTRNRPHVVNNSGNNEWYTPSKYIELARSVLGTIDLDPASCEYANMTVRAKQFYSAQNNGLDKEWNGNVWMNPPYEAGLVKQFADKFVQEYEGGRVLQGIVLVNNATETSWFANLVSIAKAVAFPTGRIRYESRTQEMNSPLQGQAFMYFGENADKFCETFSSIGWCARLWGDNQ